MTPLAAIVQWGPVALLDDDAGGAHRHRAREVLEAGPVRTVGRERFDCRDVSLLGGLLEAGDEQVNRIGFGRGLACRGPGDEPAPPHFSP